jgi:glyoxylase-like metal-dependent hydrolase (beta-lactamase superfamily II)
VVHEIYAVKYAEFVGTKGGYFLGASADDHMTPWPIDYFVWLIRGEAGDIVVDAGFSAATARKRGRTHLRAPADGLRLLGADAADVPIVILSHFHYDHVGDIGPFETARFVVQDQEMAFWTGRYASRAGFRHVVEVADLHDLLQANYDGRLWFVDGDQEIVDGVEVCLVAGHTAGMQAVRVQTERGPVVLAIDASHFYANIEGDAPFPILHDLSGMYGGFDRLRRLAGPSGMIVPGHDPEIMRRFEPVAGLEGLAVRIG